MPRAGVIPRCAARGPVRDLFDTGRALDLLLATLRGKVRTTTL
ncbi:hypothetical protein ACFW5I_10150 [Streptomyces sp. NPDC058818]